MINTQLLTEFYVCSSSKNNPLLRKDGSWNKEKYFCGLFDEIVQIGKIWGQFQAFLK
jgi:hypothetical protein